MIRVKYLLESKEFLPRINEITSGLKHVSHYLEDWPDNGEKKVKYSLTIQYEDHPPSLPALLTKIFGVFSFMEGIRLLDIDFDEKGFQFFQGPKFGVHGVREILGVYDRPLLLSVNKPQHGISPEMSAQSFYEAALGGIDILKDDELLGDNKYSEAKVRLAKMAEVIKRVYYETGRRKIFCLNVSGTIQDMIDKARLATEYGTNGIMINAFAAQMEVLRALAEHPEIQVPILVHPAHCGVLSATISPAVLFGKLLRYLGADMVAFPAVSANKSFGSFGVSQEDYDQIIKLLRLPMKQFKNTFPAPGGGVQEETVRGFIKELGKDCIILAGRTIQYHPQGPREGARFLLSAINEGMASCTA